MSGAPILITGGAGFIGCNIADRLAGEGHDVIIYDTLSRPGVAANIAWLQQNHPGQISHLAGDVRDGAELARAVAEAQAIFHMAAQVAVTTSLADPREDFEVNVLGTLNLLEAVRRSGRHIPVIFASTNKVYGNLSDLAFTHGTHGYEPADPDVWAFGISERRPLDFHTPYGCSKGAADQYVLDYSRSFGLPAAVLRMSCIYGQRQMGTEDQGWVAHFLIRAIEGRPITIYGDGHQVRDILDISDAVDAYLAVWRNIARVSGRAFNLGGGCDNAVSLRTLLDYISRLLSHDVAIRNEEWRAGDQRYFVADTRALQAELGVKPRVSWPNGVARLAQWLAEQRGTSLFDQPARGLAVGSAVAAE